MGAVVLKDRFTTGMTDEEFLWFCMENRDLRIERNSNHQIIIKSPVFTFGGFQSGEVFRQLANWTKEDKKGLAFDSSTGFTLPDRSVLSPDASWVSFEKWNRLTEDDKNRFAPICPEFVIEVRSKSDHIEDLKEKMRTWIKNGAQLGWLIDTEEKITYIFRPNMAESKEEGFDKKINATGPVEGFILDLSQLLI